MLITCYSSHALTLISVVSAWPGVARVSVPRVVTTDGDHDLMSPLIRPKPRLRTVSMSHIGWRLTALMCLMDPLGL